MKHRTKRQFIYILILVSSTLNIYSQKTKTYKINCTIEGLPAAHTIFLTRNKDTGGPDTVAYTKSTSQGSFSFKGHILHEGEVHFIRIKDIDSIRSKPITKDTFIRIILESGTIEVTANVNNLSNTGLKVTGSKSDKEYRNYIAANQKFSNEINKETASLITKYQKGEISTEVFSIEQEKALSPILSRQSEMTEKWIKDHENSYFTPWVIITNGRNNLEWMEKHWLKLSNAAKESYYGRKLKGTISLKRKTSPGAIAPNFGMPTTEGESISLHDVAKKGRYTILYFWASWCGPCRSSIPSIKAMYQRYKDKGLNIIGYSIDKDKGKWELALNQEKIPWYNALEMNLFAKFEYGIEEVPHYYVLDSNSKIIAHFMDSDSMTEKITQLLQ